MENKVEIKKEKSIVQLGLILLIITAIAGLILGLVYNVTKDSIANQEKLANENAMKALLTDADSFSKKEVNLTETVLEVNEGKKGSESVGYAIKVASKGYGGQIQLIVGIDKAGKLAGIQILSQSETAGLGANCKNPEFYGQYAGKSIDKDIEVVKTEGNDSQIKAITGATITSKGVTNGVNDAIKFYKENLQGGNK
ncbi:MULTISPECIES: RnfABCDGE type electron transport complex subunit G [Clostridium]|uniref:Ion-translocating oxidoreductase complex subunit G n=1 Tax=Clostridium cadaveris TaxID=1529 RepID=A0A1I2K0W7_9CLOT|nr:RnfABCDGE type electron transport complex subunit G [Clostridium cadaveris]MDU4952727.1 RnfABCDGE type electron transport complex subunit G [Clostridium sp.]MDM8312187.1 RnfABCDGE type electron transport complex subunit G [Clostridium cadaveris]MDY4947908.1 RnfABCDGE type electron transport complex subunit G [Clostridium cadaveris]NME64033.1 RnfABCDGE type electron transport complex subunit G [Clostridium cadaveris]NWK12174.1 RnfABCDGE type electron transport complex subunit G [Clostridium 